MIRKEGGIASRHFYILKYITIKKYLKGQSSKYLKSYLHPPPGEGRGGGRGDCFIMKLKEVFLAPLNILNPVLVQVLGICSALAVTSQLKPAIVMGLAVTVITAFSNLIISLIRKTVPTRIRIVVQLVVVAALVTVVSQVLKAYAYDVSVELSVYVGLIITNCILMGRLEAFAMQNKPWHSFVDGFANGLGYGMILVIVGGLREFLGRGSLLGWQIIPQGAYDLGYMNNGTMAMPAMALIMIGCVIWIHRAYFYKEEK